MEIFTSLVTTQIGRVGAYRNKEFQQADLECTLGGYFTVITNERRLELTVGYSCSTYNELVKYYPHDPSDSISKKWDWFKQLPSTKKFLNKMIKRG
jgi:hypothetical protein